MSISVFLDASELGLDGVFIASCLITQWFPTLCDPMNCSPPDVLLMGFPRQEYWSGLPFPSPEDLPDLGIEPTSPVLHVDSFLSESPRKALFFLVGNTKYEKIPGWLIKFIH